MKICPQCSNAYDDDYLFCLTDGNALLDGDGDGEQETVLNQKFSMPRIDIDTDVNSFCPACGLGNKANSKFCKKCGTSFVDAPEDLSSPAGFVQMGGGAAAGQPYTETVAFQSPAFTPPHAQGEKPRSNQNYFIGAAVGGAIVVLLVLFGVFGWNVSNNVNSNKSSSSGSSGSSTSNNSNRSAAASSTLPRNFQKDYEGQVSGLNLSMTLNRNENDLTGTASTLLRSGGTNRDTLSGSIDDNGTFNLTGTEIGAPRKQGIWSGQIASDGSVAGKWTKLDGSKMTPFTMREVSR